MVNPFSKSKLSSDSSIIQPETKYLIESQPIKSVLNNNPQKSPSDNKEQEPSQTNNILKLIQGDYFQGASSVTKSFAFGVNKTFIDSDGRRSVVKESSSPVSSKSFIPSIRRQRIGSVEIDIKEIASPNDSGLIYDYVLHHSEVSSRSGAKQKGKIFINNYLGKKVFSLFTKPLDMDSIKSDDLSHYNDQNFSHPSRCNFLFENFLLYI